MLLLLILIGLRTFLQEKEAIHIAFVGPLSGENGKIGQSMVKAIELYFAGINKNGGIDKLPVVLDVFDDQNNFEHAVRRAKEIVEQNKVVAVIGHNCSYCSIEGGKIYGKQNIPAITPVSTHLRVTQDNDWYFRTAFNDNLQANFLANYAKNVLQQTEVNIIQTNMPYGSYLGSVFEQASIELGLEVKNKWLLSNNSDIDEIITELKAASDTSLIFLATNANTGIKLVKAIKDAKIKNLLMAPDAYANKKFTEGFKNYFPERRNSGYYTNGIYVSTPFILDTANKYAQKFNSLYEETYQESPLRTTFYALDAAIVIVEALKQIKKNNKSLLTIRNEIRQIIGYKFISFDEAVAGSTGLNYFDEDGNALKSLSMGVYKSNRLISAFTQLQIAPDYSDNDNLLLIDNKRMYKTNVVYAGLQFDKISDFKPHFDGSKSTVSYMMEFRLWLRFQGDIKPHEIKFLNAVESIKLGEPVFNESAGKVVYQLYKVSGRFKESLYSPKEMFFANRYSIGINFRHNNLDRNKLIYVVDVLGMEVTDEQAILTKIKEIQRKTSFFKNWPIQELNFFQGVIKKKILGNPKYIDHGNTVEYSTFNTEIAIGNNAYAYHVIIPNKMAFVFFVASCIVTILLGLLSYKKLGEDGHYMKYLWFIQVLFALLLLISAEVLIGKLLLDSMDQYKLFIIKIFNILWWLAAAILMNIAIERFLWIPLERNTERKVPNLVRFITALVIYLLACFGIVGFIFEQQFTSALATGGVVTILFGLMVQIDLSNIFAGIALSIEDSFHIGDWIKIEDYDDGKVVDMNWRVTKIESRTGHILSIPNSIVSNSNIRNFSHPDKGYWLMYVVYVHAKHDPKAVEQVLIEAIFAVEQDILRDTKPIIWLDEMLVQEVDKWTAGYMVFFKTLDYQHKLRILKNVWQSIWTHLTNAGMMPFEVNQIDNKGKILKNLENMVMKVN
ncbi:MAG: ABC transporter substrate-binding protein [Candidatus Marithrix sp.]|nr:ABC transporter substrate-binding protein [Candidatus Marithrix sp.]